MATKRTSKQKPKGQQKQELASCWHRDPLTHRMLFIAPSKPKSSKQS